MVIVNSKEKWDTLQKVVNQNHFIYLQILSDVNKHPKENRVSCFYIRTILREYIVPVNHNEKFGTIEHIKVNKDQFVADLKSHKHNTMITSNELVDLNWNHYMKTNEPYDFDKHLTPAHLWYYRTHYDKDNVNDVIPLVKHGEYFKSVSDDLVPYLNDEHDQTILEVLSEIENNGVQTIDNMVYSEYNPYTSTGRPSNRFGGLNFAALNKSDGSRKQFISRYNNGVLVEMDFDAYHLRLIGEIVGYDFPKTSVHEHMAELYGLPYEEAKALSFKYLYGGITDDMSDNPFFSKVNDYIKLLWQDYQTNNFVQSYIYNRKIYRKNLHDMNPNKLFNYMIQLMETEKNIDILDKLTFSIQDDMSKLILYNYDAFLFDFNYKEDGLDYLRKIKNILEDDGKYPTRVYMGDNYHEMEEVTEKLIV